MTIPTEKSLIDSFKCTGRAIPDEYRLVFDDAGRAEIDVTNLRSFDYHVHSLSGEDFQLPFTVETSHGRRNVQGRGRYDLSPPYTGRLVFESTCTSANHTIAELTSFQASSWQTPA
ncbi:hypothetical protein GT347_06075 [Xylophilus rhododendri]|uniref:Uncharacterized protein n=1 Tax=Xylophilus rhododendri TaxID=2697032 RepID=A0A857J2W9_9BURK|nr:hypothetical protein [Xylophilus rhododendri]QHI97593.1 hypothetical protein GT347_06075 [Xylophilus rhododendri]